MPDGFFNANTAHGALEQLGGKAWNLQRLQEARVDVPPWIALTDEAFARDGQCLMDDLPQRVRAAGLRGERFAVRSSALCEDGALHSFAGQFDTLLGVPLEGLKEAAENVRRSSGSERIKAYCRENGMDEPPPPTVIIQEMILAKAAGVAFGCNMESGSRKEETVSAVFGLGEGLVSGTLAADCFFVSGDGIKPRIAEKREAIVMHEDGGTETVPLPEGQWRIPVLDDGKVREVAATVRRLSEAFCAIQDMEWAYDSHGALYVLQARPVTTLGRLPDPDGEKILWDNSNIVESYPGMTWPLTFSFIRDVYSEVYQGFCRIMGVEQELIAANRPSFEMLGLIRGRVYYNLMNWYRLIALLPGYTLNAPFMEQMMGVKEPLSEPPKLLAEPTRNPYLRMLTMLKCITGHFIHLKKEVRSFQKLFNECVEPYEHFDFSQCDFAQLKGIYGELERKLLPAWQTPIVNDFMAMVFYGLLKKLLLKWNIDPNGGLHNNLISGEGNIISAEPVRRLEALAERIAAKDALAAALEESSERFAEAVAGHPDVKAMLNEYIDKFGDRCIGELKLETITYRQNPNLLLDILRGYLRKRTQKGNAAAPATAALRADAEKTARERLRWHPFRRFIFFKVLKHARISVRNRENLRFERTRLFAVMRRIFLAFGRKLAMEGVIADERDVFFLEKRELFDWASGTATCWNPAAMVQRRKQEYRQFAAMPLPAERFSTTGAVPQGNRFQQESRREPEAQEASAEGSLQGLPCCGGIVRGIARVVLEPSCAVDLTGCILVAVRTDPGWAPLFPVCKGVLVERGSILSHAAIVTRELGIPSIVGIRNLTATIHDGDLIEMDGATGTIRKVEEGE
ncbi:MAG: hypothetical protein J5833_09240 [Victivallales bacterium]|nr:hypothetical protein [Victivallales bacterium]